MELTSPLSGSSERLSQDKAGRDKKATQCLPVASLHTSTGLVITHTHTTRAHAPTMPISEFKNKGHTWD